MHIQISICTCLYVHKHIHTDIMSGAWCSSARWTGAERCCCTQIYACPRVCGCVHARTHAHTHTHTHTHTPPHTPSSCRPPRGKKRRVRPQRPPSIQAAMATRTHPKPRVPQRVAAPRRGPREGRRALDPAPARMGASGAVMKPMAQLNRAPQHRAPLIAMRSSAVRARMRAIGFESLSAAKLGFVRKILGEL